MEIVSLQIREVRQTSSMDHVVIFDVDLLLLDDSTTIEVKLVTPSADTDAWAIDTALSRIHDGIKSVLNPRNMGAIAEVSHLKIHPIDFLERMYEKYTARYLEAALQPIELENDE